MNTWTQFCSARPELADAGKQLFYQYGVGLAFMATVRSDGGPRVHPMCPIIDGAGMYGLIIPSPKRDDLLRDGRYSMHSHPCEDNEDAFYVTGRAQAVNEAGLRERIVKQFLDERPGMLSEENVADQGLFEFFIERALLTRTSGHGDPHPRHTVWRAS